MFDNSTHTNIISQIEYSSVNDLIMITEIGSKVLKFYQIDGKLFKFKDKDTPI